MSRAGFAGSLRGVLASVMQHVPFSVHKLEPTVKKPSERARL